MSSSDSNSTSKVTTPVSGRLDPDSGSAFAELIQGFAHTPSSSSTPKRKFESPTKIRPGTQSHPKRIKKGEDEDWREFRNVNDYLGPGLDVVFCGINPGQISASAGRHFANPNNHFWSCLHEGGFTDRRVDPSEDHTLPEEFNLGMTNLVQRPTREASELTPSEMRDSVPLLLSKITHHKPKIVCFVGVGIAEIISSYLALKKGNAKGKGKRKGPGMLPFKLVYEREGEEPCRVSETLLYAVSSTSGRVVAYSKGDKVKQFQLVNQLLRQIQSGGYKTGDDVTAVYTRDLGDL